MSLRCATASLLCAGRACLADSGIVVPPMCAWRPIKAYFSSFVVSIALGDQPTKGSAPEAHEAGLVIVWVRASIDES